MKESGYISKCNPISELTLERITFLLVHDPPRVHQCSQSSDCRLPFLSGTHHQWPTNQLSRVMGIQCCLVCGDHATIHNAINKILCSPLDMTTPECWLLQGMFTGLLLYFCLLIAGQVSHEWIRIKNCTRRSLLKSLITACSSPMMYQAEVLITFLWCSAIWLKFAVGNQVRCI